MCVVRVARALAAPLAVLLAVVGGFAATSARQVSEISGTPPPWPVEARLFGSDQVFAHDFGTDVALDGDTALVGASNADIGGNTRQGAAYVFVREEDQWIEQAQLLAHDGAKEDGFGWSVGIDGDTAVVGARDVNIEGEINQGAAYVYFRVGTEWFEATKLVASDGDELDKFGHSVAIDGDTLVVGATGAAGAGGVDTGAAYVFKKEGVPWIEQAKLYDAEGQGSDFFGEDVALEGDTALVGARLVTVEGDPGRGAAYVYTRTGSTWSLEQKLLASDGAPDEFGKAVAIDGHTALIGAWFKNIDGNALQGAAYLFRRMGTIWTEQQRLTASDGQVQGLFGKATAILDGVALVGAEFDFPGDNQRGVVYEYRNQGGAWVEIQKFAAPEGNGIDLFGRSIALDPDRALIAQNGEAVLPPIGGSAWIFGRPVVFEDGFETGDTSAWNQTVP